MTTRVTSKGQVTIPKRIRDALKLKQGTKVDFSLQGGKAILEAVPATGVEALGGSLKAYAKGHGKHGQKSLLEKVSERVAEHAAGEGLVPGHKRHTKIPARR